ncbi:FAD:protein FMN transferase [Aggregatilinea lenta]|uniref:FAD:protein FMN transferase n=1 Tax=Aggregatilinea lenta TaxID=913108 RepID=UPI000E5A389A|nr:FAD:protein FMN transferase [Aggregatilinea lenta]
METYVISFRAMGSQINVWLESAEDGPAILQVVPDWVEAIEAALSRFRLESELSRLNQRVGKWTDVSELMQANLSEALRAARATDGLVTPFVWSALVAAGYDRSFEAMQEATNIGTPSPLSYWQAVQLDAETRQVWLPDRIDLGGTAKGWTAQTIAHRLAVHGACLVDLGGDIVGSGGPWRVDLHDPFHPSTPFVSLTLRDRAVATSGTDYRRWGVNQHHIIDPRTGAPALTDLVSVTVIHHDAVLAEAFAKAVLIQGAVAGLNWLAQQEGAIGLAFKHDGSVMATENFSAYIQTPINEGA